MSLDARLAAFADQLLTRVEQRELISLRWGYVDGSLSETEVEDLARETLGAAAGDLRPRDLIEALIESRLLFEMPEPGEGYRLRSRFAEGVRLLSHLRQLFPNRPWLTAPTLVSDYRVDARPRRVPRRCVTPAKAIESLDLPVASLERKIVETILSPDGSGNTGLRLARFQLEATRRILGSRGDGLGTVISAGTGSGKTLAFYLPAFATIGPLVDGERWVKLLTVYPRRELLKDQFSEAFQLARRLDTVLQSTRRRPLTLGSYCGLTPERAEPEALRRAQWVPVSGGFVCPFLICPCCGGEMLWLDRDITQRVERLTCRTSRCGTVATEDGLVLTRERGQVSPPDVVFTTVEMLHQRLSDTGQRVLLGLHPRPERRPRLVLLDEIHTYEGTSGAQSALALRRWRQAIGRPVHFVGLSATLLEAPRFFSELTGLREETIAQVTPRDEDLDAVAMAYQLILRGDPASQASLLSTSIQTAFLLARLLDPRHGGKSGGRIGQRLFMFTDDLDVTNRLFDDIRDAEAHDIFGRPDPRRIPLASERVSTRSDQRRRDRDGQSWWACERIGWALQQRLSISRTTSQDAGVDAASNVVVATSALEVGFDDPRVGAVLQHKSPHLLASYIQRKGRAGRTSAMRSWMMTVLSDYGRDRLAYQVYEQLFDPVVPPQRLPVRNRYILRMQAVFSFIDWLAELALSEGKSAWWWRTLNGPTSYALERERQQWVQGILRQLLRDENNLTERLITHLEKALQISREDVLALLWDPPRSLLLEVIPTLARRLATDWEGVGGPNCPQVDFLASRGKVHPLPDFIPPNLFSELNLPEVTVVVPPATVRHEERSESMPILAALRQLAPGRVTRRFAFERGGLNHWVPVPLVTGIYLLPVESYAENVEFVAEMTALVDGDIHRVPCYRPLTIRLSPVTDRGVSHASYGQLLWSTEFLPKGTPLNFPITPERGWGEVIRSVDFYLHSFHGSVTARRFATGARATIRRRGVEHDAEVSTSFTTSYGGPAAVGFEQDVDGLVCRLRLPDAATLADRANRSTNLPTWRSQYFRAQVLGDPALQSQVNHFQRDWLHQIYLSALLAEACRTGATLSQARDALETRDAAAAFGPTIETIFRIQAVADEADAETAYPAAPREQQLRDLFADPAVRVRLSELAANLWQPEPVEWGNWLRERLHESLGAALLQACEATAPRYAAFDTLLFDPESRVAPEEGQTEIWITESTPGGTGVIEAIAETFAADQRALFTALEAVLTPGDLELVSQNLDAIIQLVRVDADVADAIAQVRIRGDHRDRAVAREKLFRVLARRGVGMHHALGAALEHRLLRGELDPTGDALIGDLVEHWKQLEQRLGVSIDQRVFCYLACFDPDLGPRIDRWLADMSGTQLNQAEMTGVLAGLLWPRPVENRARSLESYNPFREGSYTDPSLPRDLLHAPQTPRVEHATPSWEERLLQELANVGRVELVAPREHGESLQRDVLQLLATPVDVDFLQFYPMVEQVVRTNDTDVITLILREIAAP